MTVGKLNKTAAAICIAAAVLLCVYGLLMTWKDVVLAAAIVLLVQVGKDFWRGAFKRDDFTKMRFRIEMRDLGAACERLGLSAADWATPGQQKQTRSFVFTWLEPELIYWDNDARFSTRVEALRYLPGWTSSWGAQASPSAIVEIRQDRKGYILVLSRFADLRLETRAERELVLLSLSMACFPTCKATLSSGT